MKPIAIMTSVLGIAIVGSVVASPLLVGQGVQTTLESAKTSLVELLKNQPMFAEVIRLKDSSYQRGFTNADQELILEVGCPGQTVDIKLHNYVEHGPLPGFSSLGLARVRSEIILPKEAQAELTKVTGGKSLELINSVGFDGSLSSRFIIPAGKMDDTSWNEMQLNTRLTPTNFNAPIFFDLPSAEIRADGNVFMLKGISGQAVNQPNKTFPSLTFGNSEFKLQSLTMTGKTPFTLEQLSNTNKSFLVGDQISLEQTWNIGKLDFEQKISDAKMAYTIENLDANTLNTVLAATKSNTGSLCSQDPTGALGNSLEVIQQLAELLQKPPKMTLSDLSFKTPDGQLSAKGKLEFDGALNLMAIADQNRLLEKLKLDLSVRASEKLLTTTLGVNQGLLQVQILAGYLKRIDSDLSTEIKVEAGNITANGKPLK